ncbi:hypothetical protein HYALB_00011112 [Hymenoscyphus albidus]|uniref:Uncharacterized protein n=1 Tax=Hymenoscyphus albidus TaxID=595503 RepID=A0A9N9LNR8_9HELO|nr:hypothetical protein HYALB_00011112 [Hymenoscyphus albidus]
MAPEKMNISPSNRSSPKYVKQRQSSDPFRKQKQRNRHSYVMSPAASSLPTEGRLGQNIYGMIPPVPSGQSIFTMSSMAMEVDDLSPAITETYETEKAFAVPVAKPKNQEVKLVKLPRELKAQQSRENSGRRSRNTKSLTTGDPESAHDADVEWEEEAMGQEAKKKERIRSLACLEGARDPLILDADFNSPASHKSANGKPEKTSVFAETKYYQLWVEQKMQTELRKDIQKSACEEAAREQARADAAEALLKTEKERVDKEEARANAAVREVVQAALRVSELQTRVAELEKVLEQSGNVPRRTQDVGRPIAKPRGKGWFFSSGN